MKYDLVVIGGGPAGMIMAGRAGELGARVLLIEKNTNLGSKLLITGKGRCNITNNTHDLKELIKIYGDNGKFLFSSFHEFGVQDVINFFNNLGVKTKVERGNRIFPVSDKSLDILKALKRYLKDSNVKIKTNSEVKRIIKKKGEIEKIILSDKTEILSDNFAICTGGKSYPLIGSTGDGYSWAKELGHRVIKQSPALTPIKLKESYVKELEGLSLKNVEISVYKGKKKLDSRFGEALFTNNGMSGPIIIDMSKNISKELDNNPTLKIDFKPALSFEELDLRIQKDFQENSNKMFRNSLDALLPKKMIPVVIKLSKIDEEKKVNLITKEERNKLLHLLKEFKLEINGLIGYNKAIITSGGIDLKEIDPKTMKSKIIPNLYFAGEILDLDGPTGGYNLQICWSTGYAAGNNFINN